MNEKQMETEMGMEMESKGSRKSKAPKKEYAQGERMFGVMRRLQGHAKPITLWELAHDFGVASKRSIERDVDALEHLGYRFEYDYDEVTREKNVRMVSGQNLELTLTRQQAFTLFSIRNKYRQTYAGHSATRDLNEICDKMGERVPKADLVVFNALGERHLFVPDGGVKPFDGKLAISDALVTGVIEDRVIHYTYQDTLGRTARGYLAPYGTKEWRNGMYVVGRRIRKVEDAASPKKVPLATMAFERFTEATVVTESLVVRPPGFSLKAIREGALGMFLGEESQRHHVLLDFDASCAAHVAARVWQESQVVQSLGDGRIRLSFHVARLEDVIPFVLQWGHKVRVAGPSELARDIAQSYRFALARIDGDGPQRSAALQAA